MVQSMTRWSPDTACLHLDELPHANPHGFSERIRHRECGGPEACESDVPVGSNVQEREECLCSQESTTLPPDHSGEEPHEFGFCTPGLCQNSGTCLENEFIYECQCEPGYQGDHCEVDINECETSPCMNSGACLDKVRGRNCW